MPADKTPPRPPIRIDRARMRRRRKPKKGVVDCLLWTDANGQLHLIQVDGMFPMQLTATLLVEVPWQALIAASRE